MDHITIKEKKSLNHTISITATLILVTLIGFLLWVGRGLLIPLVIAIFIWHVLNTFYNALVKIKLIARHLPNWLIRFLSLLILFILVNIVIDIISNNVGDLIAASSRYQNNLLTLFNKLDRTFHLKLMADSDTVLKNINLQNIVMSIYGVFTGITSSAVLIALYVIFLFVEQHYFRQKLDALFPHYQHRQLVNNIINHIVHDTQTYLGLKMLLSFITAVSSWIIMKSVHLDFAEFWALLIFFLNFIPNIGAIIATAFPVFLSLIQFDSWVPFLVVTSGIVIIQSIIGNIVEPRFMGKSLNLSPLVILLALALWGSIWGVLGMFLSVPITVMIMSVCAHFDKTRPLAILLSQDGHIQKAYEAI